MKKNKPITPTKPTRSKRTLTTARQAASIRVLDTERYVPTVVASLTTKLRASAQEYFSRQFGITRLEWRIISFLATEGPASAYDIWTRGSLDKAAVSRSIKTLELRGFVVIKPVLGNSRGKTALTLSPSGREINDRSFTEIVRRHHRLVSGLTIAEIEKFISVAKHLESRICLMDSAPDERSPNFNPTKIKRPKISSRRS